MSNRTVAIIQARMGSTRLPGKVLMPVLGAPLLDHMLRRVDAAKTLDAVLVATTDREADDSIAAFCDERGRTVVRGSEEDVLDRYHDAAAVADADTVVRLTADCPLLDPTVIDAVVGSFRDGGFDYAANTCPPPGTYPHGMDVEVFSRAALERAWSEAVKPSHREHVTFYFWQNPGLFRTHQLDRTPDWSRYRVTVDYPEDFRVVRSVLEALGIDNPGFTMEEAVAYLESNTAVRDLNAHIARGQGWEPSLQRDREAGF